MNLNLVKFLNKNS